MTLPITFQEYSMRKSAYVHVWTVRETCTPQGLCHTQVTPKQTFQWPWSLSSQWGPHRIRFINTDYKKSLFQCLLFRDRMQIFGFKHGTLRLFQKVFKKKKSWNSFHFIRKPSMIKSVGRPSHCPVGTEWFGSLLIRAQGLPKSPLQHSCALSQIN